MGSLQQSLFLQVRDVLVDSRQGFEIETVGNFVKRWTVAVFLDEAANKVENLSLPPRY